MPAKLQVLNDTRDEAAVCSKAAVRAAATLGLSNAVLSRVLGLSESQMSRVSRGSAVLEGKSKELAILFVRLFCALQGILGNDDDAAKSWLVTPNLALRRSPILAIQTITGLMETLSYLEGRLARL